MCQASEYLPFSGIAAVRWLACVVAVVFVATFLPPPVAAQLQSVELAPTDRHVPELARYLERLQLSEPVIHRGLAVYTLQFEGDALSGGWLTLDGALSRGVLDVSEKGASGSVPAVLVENRSRNDHVFLMQGEMIAGGKQTRTLRDDVILAPGQRVEISVFCVEKNRWRGGNKFDAANALVPQSIQKQLRGGASQDEVWSEVARNNRALQAENATGSLERALNSAEVRGKLADVRRAIIPEIPRGTTGFLFVHRGQALGAELFGSEAIARELLPKLIDSYAVDFVLQKRDVAHWRPDRHDAAIAFYNRMRRVGSSRKNTPGSGAGIRTRADGLLGDGVSLNGTLAHYGLQIQRRIILPPKPVPIIPRPLR